MGKYGLAFFIYVTVFYVGQTIIGLNRHVRKPLFKGDVLARPLLVLLSLLLMVPAVKSVVRQDPIPALMVIGAIITLFGLWLSMWAQWALGNNWVGGVGLHGNHQLITTGPYRYVRHPMHSGMLISALGLGVFTWNILYALMSILFCAGYATRIWAEEKMLTERFGKKQKYEAYASRTGRLIPRFRKIG